MPEVNVIAVGADTPAANFLYTMTVFSSTAGLPGAPSVVLVKDWNLTREKAVPSARLPVIVYFTSAVFPVIPVIWSKVAERTLEPSPVKLPGVQLVEPVVTTL